MKNTWLTVASALVALALVSGCAIVRTPHITRIALLAPFEGAYRDIGYNALYAARLGINNAGIPFDLLALDDGGTVISAMQRAAALRSDPAIAGIILIGPYATHTDVQAHLDGLPTIIVGDWQTMPAADSIVHLTHASMTAIREPLNLPDERVDLSYQSGDVITFLSPGTLPDAAYRQQYAALGEFTPPPNTLATLVTDAATLLTTNPTASLSLRRVTFQGLNGVITFSPAGYWNEAPITRYETTGEGTYTTSAID